MLQLLRAFERLEDLLGHAGVEAVARLKSSIRAHDHCAMRCGARDELLGLG
jgi:hypothetical protein